MSVVRLLLRGMLEVVLALASEPLAVVAAGPAAALFLGYLLGWGK